MPPTTCADASALSKTKPASRFVKASADDGDPPRAERMHAVRRAAQRSFCSRRHASTLIVAEHDGVKLTESTLAAITACAAMKPITLLVGGSACKAAAEAAGKASGVDSVTYVEASSLDHGVAEEWAPLVVDLAKKGGYTHIAGESGAE